MSFKIPVDNTINELQILLREEASIPFYDSGESPLPELPLLEDSISRLDPSPPYLRCKNCKGRLLGGIKSLFCMFCGKERFGETPPDPIDFRSTYGYRWFLDSLKLDEAEVVELNSESTSWNSGQNSPKDETLLSDLLNLKIPWHAKVGKPESIAASVGAPPQAKNVNVGGVVLDNYFVDGKEGEVAVNESEEQLSSKHGDEAKETIAFQSQEDVGLFENAQPLMTPMQPEEHKSDNSRSIWESEFQSSRLGAVNKDSVSFDPFASSDADTSSQSQSNAYDLQGNPRDTSDVTGNLMDSTISSSVNTDDLFLNSPVQSAVKDLDQREVEVVDKNDDSLDSLDDLTSSAARKDSPKMPSQEEPTRMNSFGSAGDAPEDDFGTSRKPNIFSDTAVADVETTIPQRQDLSVMLDSNLATPRQSNDSKDPV